MRVIETIWLLELDLTVKIITKPADARLSPNYVRRNFLWKERKNKAGYIMESLLH